MGIKKYTDTCWRVYVVDTNAKTHQKYFKTEEEAKAFFVEKTKNKFVAAKNKKKSNAKAKDIPVGLCDTFETKLSTYGETSVHPKIVATVYINQKPFYMQRSYGKIRTREEAIRLCHNWRLTKLKEMKRCQLKEST